MSQLWSIRDRIQIHYLKKISRDGARQHLGRLKIFFGYAAGVGKAYGMLEAAHEAKNNGVAVCCRLY